MAAPRLMMMIGLPVSGTSEIAHDYFEHIPVSRRQFTSEAQMSAEIEHLLRAGRQVVVDDLNLTAAERRPLLDTAKRCGVPAEGYIMLTTAAECLERNWERDPAEQLPEEEILQAAEIFEPPSYEEGFAALYSVRLYQRPTGPHFYDMWVYKEG